MLKRLAPWGGNLILKAIDRSRGRENNVSDMYFSLNVLPVTAWLLLAAAVGVLIISLIYVYRLRRIAPYARRCAAAEPSAGSPGASVVIYSRDEAHHLAALLPEILGQQYSGPFEVIVVNEGESLDVRDLVDRLSIEHPNLYLTHTPDGARSLSRKKLALTLGVKAARYPVVVHTTASARVASPCWLSGIMRHFADPAVSVVLAPACTEGASRRVAFDEAADQAAWISAALTGHPYRGLEHNLAYTRKAFFDNKGFSRSLNLRYGDDDIFVSEIARRGNTAVELSANAMVRVPNSGNYAERAMRRAFTERRIRRRPRFLMQTAEWLQLLAPAAAIAAVALQWRNWAVIAAAVLILLILGVVDVLFWRPVVATTGSRRLCWTLPWLAGTRALRRAWIELRARLSHHKRYTWD